jgi:hypothetical protein
MRIRNWQKFQHFKDRRPPWIKLHREILDQRDIMLISPCAFRVLVLLWLVASEDEGKTGELPTVEEMAFKLRMDKPLLAKALQELVPFIDDIDITVISRRYHDGPPEERREEAEKSISCDHPAKKDRQRNPLMDALAVCDGGPVGLTGTAWGRIAKALKDIKEASPDVEPTEIARRRANYFTHYPDAQCTSTALAAHWGLCATAKAKQEQPARPRNFI